MSSDLARISPERWGRLTPEQQARALECLKQHVEPAKLRELARVPSATADSTSDALAAPWPPTPLRPSQLEPWQGQTVVLRLLSSVGEPSVLAGRLTYVRLDCADSYLASMDRLAPRAAAAARDGNEDICLTVPARSVFRLAVDRRASHWRVLGAESPTVLRPSAPTTGHLPPVLGRCPAGAPRPVRNAHKKERIDAWARVIPDLFARFPSDPDLISSARALGSSGEIVSRVLYGATFTASTEQATAANETIAAALEILHREGVTGRISPETPLQHAVCTLLNMALVCRHLEIAHRQAPVSAREVTAIVAASLQPIRHLAASDEDAERIIRDFLRTGAPPKMGWNPAHFHRISDGKGARAEVRPEAERRMEEERGVFLGMRQSGTRRCPALHSVDGEVAMERFFEVGLGVLEVALERSVTGPEAA